MSYEPEYMLTATDPGVIINEIKAGKNYFIDYYGDFSLKVFRVDETVWYKIHSIMIELSKRYPDVLFTLNWFGEVNEDMSRQYFKNGKSQTTRAVITFEPFDENKLK